MLTENYNDNNINLKDFTNHLIYLETIYWEAESNL